MCTRCTKDNMDWPLFLTVYRALRRYWRLEKTKGRFSRVGKRFRTCKRGTFNVKITGFPYCFSSLWLLSSACIVSFCWRLWQRWRKSVKTTFTCPRIYNKIFVREITAQSNYRCFKRACFCIHFFFSHYIFLPL